MLESSSVDAAAKLFAATTLKGKVRWSPGAWWCVSSLTQPDRIRPSPDTPRAAARAACLYHEEPYRLPCWAKAHQTDAVCVSGQLGDTDDRMERCPHRHCQRSGYRPSNTTLRPGFPPRPPRRSHAWTKDRTHSTSGRSTTHTQPAAPSHGSDM